MNQIINISEELAKLDSTTYVVMVAIGLVVCLVYIFYGYACIRFISALIGFAIGLWAGIRIVDAFNLKSPLDIIVPCVAGVALALISYGVYRLAVFLAVFTAAFGVASSIVANYAAERMNSMTQLLAVLAVALVMAVLAEIFMRPLIIIATAVTGALSFSSLLFTEVIRVTWSGQAALYAELAVAILLAILGIVRQLKKG